MHILSLKHLLVFPRKLAGKAKIVEIAQKPGFPTYWYKIIVFHLFLYQVQSMPDSHMLIHCCSYFNCRPIISSTKSVTAGQLCDLATATRLVMSSSELPLPNASSIFSTLGRASCRERVCQNV